MFFQFYCICIFQTHILSCNGAKFLVPGVFVFFGSFCFFCLPFCHPMGNRDSLKKRKIQQETVAVRIVCVCVHMCVYVYLHMNICIYTSVLLARSRTGLGTVFGVTTCICVRVCACVYICIYIRALLALPRTGPYTDFIFWPPMRVCVCVCVCVCVYTCTPGALENQTSYCF